MSVQFTKDELENTLSIICRGYRLVLDEEDFKAVAKYFKASEETLVTENIAEKTYPHYYKQLPSDTTHIDIYMILDLFNVGNQGIGHTIKKLLCPGQRHAKSWLQDVTEARDTLNRVIELEKLKNSSKMALSAPHKLLD